MRGTIKVKRSTDQPIMLDVNELMDDLARDRPVFHSEADFQHALAWHIHEAGLDPRIRLERPVEWPDSRKRIYIDLWLPGSNIAVELKYLTRKLDFEHEGEGFALRDQSARDVRRYDFLKDMQRLEQLSSRPDVRAGLAILLTNDPLYWEDPAPHHKETYDADFRIHQGLKKAGRMAWSEFASSGTTKGREEAISLKGSYPLEWEDYSNVKDGAHRRFRYLAVQICSSSQLGEQRYSC